MPFEPAHTEGFPSLVVDTLREFGFEHDPVFDRDLDDPGATTPRSGSPGRRRRGGSVALRDLGDSAVELKRMYLRLDARGRGLGKGLLAIALDWARENDTRAVRLDTSERMEAAQRLYESAGFERVPGNSPRQGQYRLLYELRLRTP